MTASLLSAPHDRAAPPDIKPAAGLVTASATLARATRFLGAGLSAADPAPPRPIGGAIRAKVIANALRELDRFLSILIDEVAADAAPRGLDLVALAAMRNTPNKLATLLAAMGRPSPGDARLRAIGRGRDCLFHTAGIVRRGPRAIRWEAIRYTHGQTLATSPGHLAGICRFYDEVAAGLIAAAA